MTNKQLLERVAKGETLCMGYDPDGERLWWLEPSRLTVRSDVAEKIITLHGIEPSGDSLFRDSCSQTWKLNGRGRQ